MRYSLSTTKEDSTTKEHDLFAKLVDPSPS